MINWICAYCGKNTSDVDYDYLVGTNHLVCVMQSDNKKIKLENWNKLNGQLFSVMGIEFQFEKAEQTTDGRYTVWLNEEISKSPHSLMRVDLYINDMQIDIKTFVPATFSSPPYHTSKTITKDHIKDASIFIQTIGSMMMYDANVRKVLDYLDEIDGNAGARGGMSGGIIRQTMNAGTSVTYRSGGASSGLNGSSANNLW
jgi:hypothetical protein